MNSKLTNYPNFEEYKLLDLLNGQDILFKRGASTSMLKNTEYEAWQNFFISDDYSVPDGKNIAFLQPCTWSKPYDFSEIGAKFRKIVAPYENVHRVILSSSGVIPYEYQLNSIFCAYDWNILFESDEEHRRVLRNEYQLVTTKRIKQYLCSHHYDAVIHIGLPIKQSLAPAVKQICDKEKIPYYRAPLASTYSSLKDELLALRDSGDFFTLPKVTEDISNITKEVSEKYWI